MRKKALHNWKLAGIGIGIFAAVIVFISLSPIATNEILGLKPNFNVGTTFNVFEGLEELTVVKTEVKSTVIKCSIGSSLWGFTDAGKKIFLSTALDEGFAPSTWLAQQNVLDKLGRNFQKFSVETKLSCENISSKYPPILIGGFLNIDWKGVKKDGSYATLFSSRKDIIISPTNMAGNKITLATWEISKSEIENKLSTAILGDNFKSLQNIQVYGILNFKQGTANVPIWSYGKINNIISITLVINKENPFIIITDQYVDFKLVEPTENKLNIQTQRIAKFIGTLKDYSTDQGLPYFRVYYTQSGSVVEQSIPIHETQLSPTRSANGLTEFEKSYPFSTNAKLGKYTFEFSGPKRDTKPRIDLLVFREPVKPTPAQCEPPQVIVDGQCKLIDETPTPPGEFTCPQGTSLQNGICLPEVGNVIGLLQQYFGYIAIFIIILIIIVILARTLKPKPRQFGPYGY